MSDNNSNNYDIFIILVHAHPRCVLAIRMQLVFLPSFFKYFTVPPSDNPIISRAQRSAADPTRVENFMLSKLCCTCTGCTKWMIFDKGSWFYRGTILGNLGFYFGGGGGGGGNSLRAKLAQIFGDHAHEGRLCTPWVWCTWKKLWNTSWREFSYRVYVAFLRRVGELA